MAGPSLDHLGQKLTNLHLSVCGGLIAGCKRMVSVLWSFLHFECSTVTTMFMEEVADEDYDNYRENKEKEVQSPESI